MSPDCLLAPSDEREFVSRGRDGCLLIYPHPPAASQQFTPTAAAASSPPSVRSPRRVLYKYVCMTDLAPRIPVSDVILGKLLSNHGKCFGGSNFSVW